MARAIRFFFKWVLFACLGLVLAIAVSIGWVETQCHGKPYRQSVARFIQSPEDRRPEARSFLTYPEWHIVYAYQDYAEVLEGGAPQDFDYWQAVRGFWTSACAVTAEADRYGNPGSDARMTLYVIGASFTVEMAAKALYENTVGRVVTALAGVNTTQDRVEAEMAAEYGQFLLQTPWYRFDFPAWRARLWDAPMDNILRGLERRLALGLEWSAKAAYARAITGAVGMTGDDEIRMKIVVSRLSPEQIAGMPSGRVVEEVGSALIVEVPRYRIFTQTAQSMALAGGEFVEIAGNDDILVSLLSRTVPRLPGNARIILRVPRHDGIDRFLVALPVEGLSGLIRTVRFSAPKLEHIYDY